MHTYIYMYMHLVRYYMSYNPIQAKLNVERLPTTETRDTRHRNSSKRRDMGHGNTKIDIVT